MKKSREEMYSELLRTIANHLENSDILSIGCERHLENGYDESCDYMVPVYNGRDTITIEFGRRATPSKRIKSTEELAKIAFDAVAKELGKDLLDRDEVNDICVEFGEKLDKNHLD